MELTLGGLVVLALVDSTSAGTLGIPVWMLARQRIRVRPVLGYLAMITLFYWLLGVALLLGLDVLARVVGQLGENPVVLWGQLALGAGLPYLAAMGLLINSGLTLGTQLVALVGYVIIMVAPALVLLVLRVGLARTVEPLLDRINAWFAKRSDALIGWVLGIVWGAARARCGRPPPALRLRSLSRRR